MVIAAGNVGRVLTKHLEQQNQHCILGVVGERVGRDTLLPNVESLSQIVQSNFVEEIIVALPCERTAMQRAVQIAQDNHLDVKVIPDLFGYRATKFQTVGNIPLLTLHEQPRSWLGLSLKRALDIVVSALLLAALAPILLMIASAIVVESRGPLLYVSMRVGRNGRRFRCYKFRSMVRNANDRKPELRLLNQRTGPIFKIADDPRITRVGKVLRRYSLDELPQLWNVVKGDMSLVGPRPHPTDDFERYQLDDLKRLRVTPGLTGLWQVTARQDSSFARNMELDLEYIRNWSLWMDFRILCRTVVAVVKGSGT